MKSKEIQTAIISAGSVIIFGVSIFATGIHYAKKATIWENKYNKVVDENEQLKNDYDEDIAELKKQISDLRSSKSNVVSNTSDTEIKAIMEANRSRKERIDAANSNRETLKREYERANNWRKLFEEEQRLRFEAEKELEILKQNRK